MTLQLRTVDATEARMALTSGAVKGALRSAFAGLANGRSVQPTQTITEFPDSEGDCIFYPGLLYDLDLVGMKISPFISALSKAGKPPVTAYTLLLSVSTGEPVLLCDSLALTTARTAATTALALDYLTPHGATRLAIIGSGPIAFEHLRYVADQKPWTSIRMWSPKLALPDADELLHQKQRAVDEVGADAEVVTQLSDALDDADVILLCTSSATPVLDVSQLKPDVTISSVSTSGARAHEVDPSELERFQVFCDYRATAPQTAGEMIIAQESGWDPSAIVADLPELVTAANFEPPPGRRFFRSTGLGVEDLAIASLLR